MQCLTLVAHVSDISKLRKCNQLKRLQENFSQLYFIYFSVLFYSKLIFNPISFQIAKQLHICFQLQQNLLWALNILFHSIKYPVKPTHGNKTTDVSMPLFKNFFAFNFFREHLDANQLSEFASDNHFQINKWVLQTLQQ